MNDVSGNVAGPGSDRDYRGTSFWLSSTVNDDLKPRPPLSRNATVDVAILGAGFSGLWTAYYLLRDNPGIEVAIVEKEISGFGASGRNGGWCSPRFPVEASALERRVGAERARATILALHDAVEEIGRVTEHEQIDAHYRNTGLLSLARGPRQLPAVHAAYRSYERLGLGSYNRLLNAREAYELVHATDIAGGMLTSVSATVHPANLARGLARAVERLGGVIYEQSEVTAIEPGDDARLATHAGTLRARKAIVAAGEAYLTRLPQFQRSLLPMSSMIVLTAPLTKRQWSQIGWQGGQSLSSQSNIKNYLTRTLDGRILYGSRGAPYHFGSAIPDSALRNETVFEWMRTKAREWFPALNDVEFTHAWGGYLGVPRDWMPAVHFDESAKFGRLLGYTGRGVSTSNLAARLLAGLIAKRPSGFETLPIHRRSSRRWEPEPFRWAAVRYLQNAYERIDAAEDSNRERPWDAPIADYLGYQ